MGCILVRHVICCGCSFTRDFKRYNINGTDRDFGGDAEKFFKWLHYLAQNLKKSKVYNLGNPTNDNAVIRKSVIYRVDKLLKEGVSPKDIIVLTQWSSWQRNSFFISRQHARETNSLLHNFKGEPNEFAHISDFIGEKIQVGQFGYYLLTGGFAADHVPYPIKNLIDVYGSKFMNKEDAQINFFENIIFLQSYLKSHNIKNLSFNLQNNFSKIYLKDGFPLLLNNERNPYKSIYVDKFIPNTIDDDKKLEYPNPYIKHLYDMIDFDKFWFHKNKDTLFGGMMEWAVQNYDIEKDTEQNGLWQEWMGMEPKELQRKMKRNMWCFGHLSPMMNEKFVKQELLNDKILLEN